MKKDTKGERWSQRRIQSIEVGFQIIRALEAADVPLPLRDVSAAAGMPPSKAHLYLVSFIREGLVRQDPETGRYGLGSFAIQLGHSAIRQLDVVELAREELINVRQATGFATYLSLWGNRGPAIVSKVDGQRQGSLAVRLGYVLPLTVSATGLVFLAFLDRGETADLVEDELASMRRDEESWPGASGLIAEPAALEARIAEVRADGYALSKNSINANFAAMAAPVFDHSHRICASITVLGSDKAITGSRSRRTASILLETTARLSGRLGYDRRGTEREARGAPGK